MITEDYVSFETAKLLKEKGFDERCTHYYKNEKYLVDLGYSNIHSYTNSDLINEFSAPTLQMTMKWLRKKGIYITIVYGDYPSLNKVFWIPQIDSLEGFDLPDSFYKEYDKYEGAAEAAIKYCLQNLIQ